MIGNIYINGQIGTFDNEKGVNLIDVITQVKQQPEATAFNVYINSEGGLVDVGFDIYNYLRSLGKPITTIGVGLVASIATVIFMAGDTRTLRDNTKFMIHLPWVTVDGNADELRTYAEELTKIEKEFLAFFKKALNLEEEALRPLLKNESWLTVDQLTTLGFLTSQPTEVAPKAYFKPKNKMEGLNEKDKTFFEGLFDKLMNKLKPQVKAKVVQDATGAELDFGEVADDATIEVGATATVDGKPAEGEYTMPDGEVYVFEAGVLTEIKPVEEEDEEMAAIRQENEDLKTQLEAANAAKASAEKKLTTIEKDVQDLRKQVMSKFKVDDKKDGKKKPAGETDRTAGIKEYLNSKRKR